jgi:phosphoglycolate phosphatase
MFDARNYKALIIDFDGTIAETLDDIAMCMTQAFERMGAAPPTLEAVRSVMSVPLTVGIPRLLGRQCSPEEADEWVNCYRSFYNGERERRTRLLPGAKELLLRARDTMTPAILVSNKGSIAIAQETAWLGIEHLITKAFPVDAVEYKKPDPRLYHCAIKSCLNGVPDSDVLVIGDSDADIEFAKNAGLRSCWVKCGYGNREHCLSLQPDIVAENLAELLPIIF